MYIHIRTNFLTDDLNSELVTKCRHENKFLLKNFNSND